MKKLLFLSLFLFFGTARAGVSDFFYLEGKVIGFDDKYVEILTGQKTVKIPLKNLASDQVKQWKMNKYVSLKVATDNFFPKAR